jgi:hypothetical protein
MGKLIISETERKNILSLYESTNTTPPPSESILIANKNPFKYSEYESARQIYSSNLKDGQMFYEYNRDINDEYGKNYVTNFYKPLLINKSMRGDDDKNYVINNITSWFNSYFDLQYPTYENGNTFKLYLIYDENNEFGSCININPLKKEVDNCPIPTTEMKRFINIKDPFKNQINVNNKVLNFIKSNLPIVKRLDYPDNGFSIKKVQRQQTDF